MDPLIIWMTVSHISVGSTIMLRRVASDLCRRSSADNDCSVSSVVITRALVVDENVTLGNPAWWGKMVSAGTFVTEFSEAITEVLGSNLLNSAWVSTAWSTNVKRRVSTSDKALANEVSAVTTVGGVSAVFTSIV